jgi:hypothetical protein
MYFYVSVWLTIYVIQAATYLTAQTTWCPPKPRLSYYPNDRVQRKLVSTGNRFSILPDSYNLVQTEGRFNAKNKGCDCELNTGFLPNFSKGS